MLGMAGDDGSVEAPIRRIIDSPPEPEAELLRISYRGERAGIAGALRGLPTTLAGGDGWATP